MARYQPMAGEDFCTFAVPLFVVFASSMAGLLLPWAAALGWVVLALLERVFLAPSAVDRPSVVEEAAALRVRVPVRGWIGPLALIGALGVLGLFTLHVFRGGMSVPELIGLPVGLAIAGLALTGIASSAVVIRVDAERRRLAVRRSALRRHELVLGEVLGVHAAGERLSVRHTGGELQLALGPHEPEVVAELAQQLDDYARAHGADPQAAGLRRRAAEALAGVRGEGER